VVEPLPASGLVNRSPLLDSARLSIDEAGRFRRLNRQRHLLSAGRGASTNGPILKKL